MRTPSTKVTIALLSVAILLIGGVYAVTQFTKPDPGESLAEPWSQATQTPSQARDTQPMQTSVIGTSVEGRAIEAYTFGSGDTHLLFVGGIHGGYEWNSVLLSWQLIDYLQANPATIPGDITVSVIPSANPDGLYAALGTADRFTAGDVPADANFGGPERFNANSVDLNRNFDCNWQPTSTWRGQEVGAGTGAFSEPEAKALRDYVTNFQPDAAVFFHSAAGAVYGAACDGTLGPGTERLLQTYAKAAGYRAVDLFTAYPITGDIESWLTKQGIPAVSVELSNHTDVELQKNLAGIKALFGYYSQL